MALRLAATPSIRNTARLMLRQQPMGLVKIHSSVAQSNAVATHKPDRLHGSYHWDLERAVCVALVPLVSTQLAFGASPVLDTLLGVMVPLHVHIGFDACITDYFNPRKSVVLNKLMTGALWASTTGVLVGCYQFNTNDIGITEFLCKLWA